MKRLLGLIGYKTFSEAVSRLCSFAVVVGAARYLPTLEFGLFSLAWAAGWIVAALADFGLQLLLAREVARSPDAAASTFRRFLRIRVIWSLALFVVVASGYWVYGPPSAKIGFLAMIAVHLGTSFIDFMAHFFRGISRSDLDSSLNLMHRVLGLLLALAVLGFNPHLAALGGALLAATALTAMTSLVLGLRLSPVSSQRPSGEHPQSVSSMVRQALPIGLGIVLSVLYFRADLFLIEWWVGTQAVGKYNAVFRLVDGLRLIPAAVLAVVFPILCRDRTWRTLGATVAGLLATSAVLAAGGSFYAANLVSWIYGPEFLDAVPALQILFISLPLLFVNFVLTHQLTASNLQRFYAVLCLGGLICNVTLNWSLIPRLSIAGAAWSTLWTEVFLTLGCVLVLRLKDRRHLGIDT